MREIKFRAWDKREKVMHQRVHEWYDSLGDRKGEPMQTEDYFGALFEATMSEDSEVLRYEVMQYTGRKEMNGVEIYEGDIVQLSNGSMGNVTWAENYTRFCFCIGQNIMMPVTFKTIIEWELTVCGNIYENPELITAVAE